MKQDSFIEDSFSVISMIDEMKQPNKVGRNYQQSLGQDILSLMAQTESKSPNTSVDFKNDINNNSDEKNFANISLIGESSPNKHSS